MCKNHIRNSECDADTSFTGVLICYEESDAKSEKRQTDAAVAGLEDRVQARLVQFQLRNE